MSYTEPVLFLTSFSLKSTYTIKHTKLISLISINIFFINSVKYLLLHIRAIKTSLTIVVPRWIEHAIQLAYIV